LQLLQQIDLHRLWLQGSWAIRQCSLAVWDEEHIQSGVEAMVLLHHAGLQQASTNTTKPEMV